MQSLRNEKSFIRRLVGELLVICVGRAKDEVKRPKGPQDENKMIVAQAQAETTQYQIENLRSKGDGDLE